MIRVADLSMAFGGVKALSGISFAVEPGALFAVIGPNGAGKATLFDCLTAICRP